MAELPTDEQRRLGIAVARRALRDTFVVRIDGIDVIDSSDAKTWPSAYVEGMDASSPQAAAAAFLSRRAMFADDAARAASDKIGGLIFRQATGTGDHDA
jgi:hypothetical protein